MYVKTYKHILELYMLPYIENMELKEINAEGIDAGKCRELLNILK